MKVNQPNFFLIGAMKSGTTSLYHYLNQHPDIFFPENKEPHYFAFKDDPEICKGPGDDERFKDMIVRDYDAYLELYKKADHQSVIGDASAMYIYYGRSAKEIHDFNPDAKILVILRNPVERALSSYKHLLRDDRETIMDFQEALDAESERVANNFMPIWFYQKAGLYGEQLAPFVDLFGDQVKILLYDDLVKDQQGTIAEIFRYLGVDDTFMPATGEKFNISGIPKSRVLHSLTNNHYGVKKMVTSLMPKSFRNKVKSRVNQMNIDRHSVEMSQSARANLAKYFQDDIRKLETLTGRDLSHWLKVPEQHES